jgi:hypothetical protein
MRHPLALTFALLAACSADRKPAPPTPGPLVESIRPTVVCNQQLVKSVRLAGENLTPQTSLTLLLGSNLDGSAGSHAVTPLPNPGWQRPELMLFQVDPSLGLAAGLYDVGATNPDGQSHAAEQSLVVVSPPSVSGLLANAACDAITVSGAGFVAVGERFPLLELLDDTAHPVLSMPVEPTSCFVLPRRDTIVQVCTTLATALTTGALPPGHYTVRVTNPADAACQSPSPSTQSLIVDGAGCHS